MKRDLWEGGHRVPFIVRWPGVVAAGKTNPALTSQVDVMATLAAVTGYALPAGTAEDSYNQLDVWKGGAASPRHTIVHNTMADGYAVRHDQWLLVAAKTGAVTKVPPWFEPANGYTKNDQPGELYDLSQDLPERRNLYAQQPEKVAELQSLLAQTRQHGQVR